MGEGRRQRRVLRKVRTRRKLCQDRTAAVSEAYQTEAMPYQTQYQTEAMPYQTQYQPEAM
eukprot:2155938-Rhodomonas_salina.1